MKKTISVNLANRNFYIEEDAYHMLDDYIKSIREHFRSLDPDGEVAQDFENRLSELFDEKMRMGYNVISVRMASEVIRQLGEVEDFADEGLQATESGASEDEFVGENNFTNSESSTKSQYAHFSDQTDSKEPRKLFREPRGKWLGGVLSGLAEYVDTDPMLLRLIFIILVFTPIHFVVVVLYIAAWIFLPTAKTAADRLAMEGKKVTSENLWTKISEDSNVEIQGNEEAPIEGEATTPTKKKSKNNWVWWVVAAIALAGAVATLISLLDVFDNGFLDFLPPGMDTGVTVFVAIILGICALGLGLLLVGLVIYAIAILPIGIIIRSEKMTAAIKILLIIAWLGILSFWIW